MAINVIGTPSSGTLGALKIAYYGLMAAHVLVGLGLLAGALLTFRNAGGGPAISRLAGLGGLGVAVAFVAGLGTGVVTMIATPGGVLGGDLLSYLMAVGFIAAFIFYGTLYWRTSVWVTRPAER